MLLPILTIRFPIVSQSLPINIYAPATTIISSITPVANLAIMNYPSSLSISLNSDVLLSKTQSLFVMYANATPTIQAIIFDIAASIPTY